MSMPNQTLFPLNEQLTPLAERMEPVLWLKRVVVLPDLQSDTPIRDISFRCGLNIVQTRQRQSGEATVVGHSVGKTLLMRLIRYTLGEHHFAVERVRTRIGNLFATAQVVAHWRVNGVDWIVVRPLKEAPIAKSITIQSDDWLAAILNEQAHKPFAEFLTAVSQTAFSELSEFTLPRARRSPKWPDVLGWFARDYECGYRAPNEWRHEDADSGPALDRDDNSLIIQWMSGLMASEEIQLKHLHQQLLDERQQAKANRDNAQRTIEVTGPELLSKLEMSIDQNASHDGDGLFAAQVVETANNKITSLQGLKDERIEQSTLEALLDEEETARNEWNDSDAEMRASLSQIKLLEGRITQIETADTKSFYETWAAAYYDKCTSNSCPMKLDNRPVPDVDPAKEQLLASIREDIESVKQSLPNKQLQRDARQTAYAAARQKVAAERTRLATETSGIDREIGRWQSYKNDADKYRQARKTLDDSTTTITTLDGKIDVSNQTQEIVRQNLKDRLNRLSACYDFILKKVFGEQASGQISVDGKGLHPVPDSRLAPNGAALSIMTTVLAFDISNVAASIAGIGHHPRLLLHDSPREGDMEEPLFQQLFQIVRDLELLFGENEPSFQYIVTTTTPPSPELADENGPFVRITLDARVEENRLLRKSF
jgi:hypothetical protein